MYLEGIETKADEVAVFKTLSEKYQKVTQHDGQLFFDTWASCNSLAGFCLIIYIDQRLI